MSLLIIATTRSRIARIEMSNIGLEEVARRGTIKSAANPDERVAGSPLNGLPECVMIDVNVSSIILLGISETKRLYDLEFTNLFIMSYLMSIRLYPPKRLPLNSNSGLLGP